MIRELTIQDIDQVITIYCDRIGLDSTTPASDPKIRQLWIDGITKYYLTTNNEHAIYGYFNEIGDLISYVGWRMDLPAPYDDGWAIAHLKTKPGSILPSQNGMVKLWKKMFEVCEDRGLKRWHAIIRDKTWSKFDSFYKRYIPEINSNYIYYDLCKIPPYTRPEIDWVWAMIGRQTWGTELRVRTGERKNI